MYKLIILLVLFSCQAPLNAQVTNQGGGRATDFVKLQLSGRINMSNREVAQVVETYQNYINSSPDSIYDNPYWNQKEKNLYTDFDFSRLSMFFVIPSQQLLRLYPPFVMSVEQLKDKEKYQIRVLYASSNTDEAYTSSKIWCIHKLSVIKEKGRWYLENLLVEETLDWQKKKIGFIEYVYPQDYVFDRKKGDFALKFCHKILGRFNPDFKPNFQFYITNSIDDMGRIENFDFYFAGITTGKAREAMILSAKGDEFYPHEFVHKLLPKNEQRGFLIEEGLASFLGTKKGDNRKYVLVVRQLVRDYGRRDTYTLENILNSDVKWNNYQINYPAGSIICEIIHERKGDAGLIKLMNGSSQNYEEIMKLVSTILNIKEAEFKSIWDKKINDFR